MIQRNFILTDIMKTGEHQQIEQFINLHSLPNQTIDCTGEYYTLHNHNLDLYDRKLAIIDMNFQIERIILNQNYRIDLFNRMKFLKNLGFKFIFGVPWESKSNIIYKTFITNKLPSDIKLPYEYYTWTGGVVWFWSYMSYKHRTNKFKFNHSNDKKFDFLYLNKFPREHRVKLFKKMQENKLLENSLYSFIRLETPIRLPTEYELPFVDAKNYPFWGKDQDLYEKPYNDTKYSLVSETNDTNDEIFITEKIWKPIIAKHIFIVHGNYQYLKTLRDMGFKTFNDIFDESYDNELNLDKRIELIVNVCKELKDMDWKKLYKITENIREHNYKTFFNKDLLSKEINKELTNWFEFFDSSQISS